MNAKNMMDMTPLFPEIIPEEVNHVILEFKSEVGKLSSILHPLTAKAMSALVVNMNSYYSNLIEGQFTHPVDIEKALKKNYSKDEKKKLLQLESVAHVRVNNTMRDWLAIDKTGICSVDFLCKLHRNFYEHLPKALRVVETDSGERWEVIPGELRHREVRVGRHVGPLAKTVPGFLELFGENYAPEKISNPVKRILAVAASHHRLAWIHPFQDGNGRVLRLFSEAYFIHEGLDANGLWSISRGLAVYKKEYYERLSNADNPRLNDYDGRGNLSERYLNEFCLFFLNIAIDQVKFMSGLFEPDRILERIDAFSELMVIRKELRPESKFLLRQIFMAGGVSKGEVAHITGKSDNVARDIMNSLLKKGLIKTETDEFRSPLTMNFPAKYAPYFFPLLYPPDIEATMINEQ